jgi:hypothetical protein
MALGEGDGFPTHASARKVKYRAHRPFPQERNVITPKGGK